LGFVGRGNGRSRKGGRRGGHTGRGMAFLTDVVLEF